MAFFSEAVTATTCLLAAVSLPVCWISQFLRVLALSIVSDVVKVFDITITSVSSASRPFTDCDASTGSTFERNLNTPLSLAFFDALGSMARACDTKSVARYDPPMPTTMTFFRIAPLAPLHSPFLTLSAKSSIRSSTLCTSGTTSFWINFPSSCWIWVLNTSVLSARKAMCKTARASVGFVSFPSAMSCILRLKSARSDKRISNCKVSCVIFCREKSTMIPSCSTVKPLTLSSSAMSSLKCGNPFRACSSNECHSGVSHISSIFFSSLSMCVYDASPSAGVGLRAWRTASSL
mmetsp:Transcript_17740/g.24798  ORF Transcript_17740/g.24798 Transcript_17740/m.24798 type:complete len:292 (+) Transcript_17740:1111-1986(+)